MTMRADEFRERVDRLGMPRRQTADLLGLSLHGLFHQLRGDRAVSRQTELLLQRIEAERQPLRARTSLRSEGRRRDHG
jgi:hypothetical protein